MTARHCPGFTIFARQMQAETSERGDGIFGCPRPNGHLGLYEDHTLVAESVWSVPPGCSWWDFPDKVFELVADWRNRLQAQRLRAELAAMRQQQTYREPFLPGL